jgi:phospholipase/carboxylesterase
MNRLRTADVKPTESFAGRLHQRVDSGAGPLVLFGPLHYEPGYAYPLVVWLHGPGDDETQLKRIMPLVSMQNFVAVAPRGVASVIGGFTWPRGDRAACAEERIRDSVAAAARRYHIHPERIFLAGFDDGGTMALRAAMNRPEEIAGVLSLCGSFPRQGTPLARLAEARRVPLFMACGRDSRRYSPKHVCRDLRLLHAAGMDVTLRQYPCGHEITLAMLADVNRWIMEQIGASCSG